MFLNRFQGSVFCSSVYAQTCCECKGEAVRERRKTLTKLDKDPCTHFSAFGQTIPTTYRKLSLICWYLDLLLALILIANIFSKWYLDVSID